MHFCTESYLFSWFQQKLTLQCVHLQVLECRPKILGISPPGGTLNRGSRIWDFRLVFYISLKIFETLITGRSCCATEWASLLHHTKDIWNPDYRAVMLWYRVSKSFTSHWGYLKPWLQDGHIVLQSEHVFYITLKISETLITGWSCCATECASHWRYLKPKSNIWGQEGRVPQVEKKLEFVPLIQYT